MDAIEALLTRNSNGKLEEPAPPPETLETFFKAAFRAPDHAMLKPWHFIVTEKSGRDALGQMWADAAQKADPSLSEAEVTRFTQLPLRAPLIITGICRYQEHPKVPRVEQIASTAAALQNILLAVHASGFAGYWRTGPLATNVHLKEAMDLKDQDEIVGFLYIGTASSPAKPLKPVDQSEYVSYFPEKTV